MQVRVFEAADMASGLKMVKKELGPNALILSTKTTRKGTLGLLGKPVLEITAAIDSDFPGIKAEIPQENVARIKQPEAIQGETRRGFHHIVDDSEKDPPPQGPTSTTHCRLK